MHKLKGDKKGMKYIDIYNHIIDPLEDEETYDKLAEAFGKQKPGRFYNELINVNPTEYSGYIMSSDKEDFDIYIFNKWKNAITSLTSEEIKTLTKQGLLDDQINTLKKYLETVSDVTTEEEYKREHMRMFKEDELEAALDKYHWSSYGAYSSWAHINSRYLNGQRNWDFPVEHRLYLNVSGVDVYKIINQFMKKCDENNLIYYFKFTSFADRDDTIVVYSDTERLPWYIEILQEIEKENPDIVERSNHPPILSGKIDEFIGYGSEPAKNKTRQSFNEKREKCVVAAFEEALQEWLKENRLSMITYKGVQGSLIDYLTAKAVMSNQKRLINRYKSSQKKDYNIDDVVNLEYRKYVREKLRPLMEEAVDSYISKRTTQYNKAIELSYPNGKIYKISNLDLQETLNGLVPLLMHRDNNFRTQVKSKMKQKAFDVGIDPNKFCFDLERRKLLEERDIKHQQFIMDMETQIYHPLRKYRVPFPRPQAKYETDQAYLIYIDQFLTINKPRIKELQQQYKATHSQAQRDADSFYQVHQDDDFNNNPSVVGMSPEEIRQAQIQCGFVPDGRYGLTHSNIIQDDAWNTSAHQVVGMTDEEIIAAQKKIGTYQPTKKGK